MISIAMSTSRFFPMQTQRLRGVMTFLKVSFIIRSS